MHASRIDYVTKLMRYMYNYFFPKKQCRPDEMVFR